MHRDPKDFISPHLDNPWMVTAAEHWIAEVGDNTISPDTGINIFAWSVDNPEASFSVIQTILFLFTMMTTYFLK